MTTNPDYSKGYAAGRRRRKADMTAEQHQRERQAFLDKAFLAALPVFLGTSTWQMDGKKVTTLADRTALAWRAAERALAARRVAK